MPMAPTTKATIKAITRAFIVHITKIITPGNPAAGSIARSIRQRIITERNIHKTITGEFTVHITKNTIIKNPAARSIVYVTELPTAMGKDILSKAFCHKIATNHFEFML